MKKICILALCVSSVLQVSAKEKHDIAFTVRLANTQSLVASINEIGQMSGNMMLAMIASQAIVQNGWTGFFGPARAEDGLLVAFFVENGEVQPGVLYPVSCAKKDFLAANPGAVESNSLVRTSAPSLCADAVYVAFDKTGKWASASENPRQARQLLSFIGKAGKNMGKDLARLDFNMQGVSKLDIDPVAKAELLKMFSSGSVSLGCNSSGIEVRSISRLAKGSPFENTGFFKSNPLLSVSRDAIAASAASENYTCMNSSDLNIGKMFEIYNRLFKDTGILSCKTKDGSSYDIVFNPESLFKALKNPDKLIKKEALEEAQAELMACAAVANTKGKTAGKEGAVAISVKGYKPPVSIADKFAKVIPEASRTKNCSLGAISLYSFCKALLPVMAADPDFKEMLGPIQSMLPPDGDNAIAWVVWKEKDALKSIMRVSKDEIKAVAQAGMAIGMLFSQQMIGTPSASPVPAK